MIIKSIKYILSIGLVAFLAFLAYTVTVQDQKETAHRRTLPTMEPVGEFQLNRRTVYLYGFDFEGKRCLWAERLKHSGLTCWDVK